MSQTTMTVRLNGLLSDFVAGNVGGSGSYENVSEYIRDLIRRDKERVEQQAFQRLKAELTLAFSASEGSYVPLTATDVIKRNQVKQV
ncbi:MAG: addiction module antitoxin [Thermodesulfobacteriota bacterium]|nr:addiction module antitoxin [Thermodesulfobacteriota bacterium]